MSRRYIDNDALFNGDNDQPLWRLALGWNPPTGSFYLFIEDKGLALDRPFATEHRNKMVHAETVAELLALLEPLADDGFVKWPVNKSLVWVLEDDRDRNLHTERQEFDEVEPRPVTAMPIPTYWEETEDPALAEEMYLAAIAAGVEVAPAFYEMS